MSACIALRDDYDSLALRDLARRSRDPRQVRRLLALAAAYDGMSRTAAAKVGGMDRQTLRDWAHRFIDEGPDGLKHRSGAGRSPAVDARTDERTLRDCYSAYVFDADRRANLLTSVESIGSKFGAEQQTGLDRAPFAPGRPEKGILAPRRPRLPRDWQTRLTAHHWPPRRPPCWKHRPPCPPPAPRSAGPPRRKSRRPNPGARVFARASASRCYSARKFDPLNQGISTG